MENLLAQYLQQYFAGIAVLVAAVISLSAWLNKALEISGSIFGLISAKQFVSWVLSVIGVALGAWLDLGFLAGFTWYWYIIYGVAVGLAANGVYDLKFIQSILKKLKLILPK